MMRSVEEIIGYELNATDGEFGKCKDLLFDDRWWTIRHMVASTGPWLIGRLVLVSPLMIQQPDWESRNIYLNVSRETIENCPSPMEDETVSQEHENKMALYYGYPNYWADEGIWGPVPNPAVAELMETEKESEDEKENPDQTTSGLSTRSRDIKSKHKTAPVALFMILSWMMTPGRCAT